VLRRAPSDAVEAPELRAALFLDDAAELGVEAAMSARALDADAEDARRAIAAYFVAHARSPEHAHFHVLQVATGQQEIHHEIDGEADRDRGRIDTRDDRIGPGRSGLAGGRAGFERAIGGLHAGEHAL